MFDVDLNNIENIFDIHNSYKSILSKLNELFSNEDGIRFTIYKEQVRIYELDSDHLIGRKDVRVFHIVTQSNPRIIQSLTIDKNSDLGDYIKLYNDDILILAINDLQEYPLRQLSKYSYAIFPYVSCDKGYKELKLELEV